MIRSIRWKSKNKGKDKEKKGRILNSNLHLKYTMCFKQFSYLLSS